MFYYTEDLNDGNIYLYMVDTHIGDTRKNWLPAYYFDIRLTADDTAVGRCDLRIGQNANTPYIGNVGYYIYPTHRGRGFAARAVRLLAKQAKKHGMQHLTITCDSQNLPSRRVCEKVGCVLETVVKPPDLPDFADSKPKEIAVYKLIL